MEKIININFQGRVIPIEEGAYNNLKLYVDSLRRHFANEESSDEIISDIENRIAELFSERIKRGASCISNSDVTAVADSIGRLEDIEAAEGEEYKDARGNTAQPQNPPPLSKDRFFRSADDKVIAGVCSGIAIRTGIDPIVVRILFVLLFGALVWIYLLLWIIVPSQSIQSNITRRLYRNPDDKVIAGVCGGLAVYFRTESWVPRLIFVLPLLLTILSGGIHAFWWHWPWGVGPRIFTGSFGSTLFILYIILWIALPYATSAVDKMEMRGEKIDMNSIKAATRAKQGNRQPGPSGSGLGRVIGILFKAFFLSIGGIIALVLFCVLIALVFAGFVAMPFTDFLLGGWSQYALAWTGIILFLGIPLLALIIWLIRRIMGVRSHRHYLGYVFAGLWLIGFISMLTLCGTLMSNFGARSMVEGTYQVHQPAAGKLFINVTNEHGQQANTHHGHWTGDGSDDTPFRIINNDSLWLNTVKVEITQSNDSLYHIYEDRISRGNTTEDAKNLASHISFTIDQHDSVLTLPGGFAISNKDKFRNQQVLITVEVPTGKTVVFNKYIHNYNWFDIKVNRGSDFSWGEEEDDNEYKSNRSYIMTASGLKDPLDSTAQNTDDDDDVDDK